MRLKERGTKNPIQQIDQLQFQGKQICSLEKKNISNSDFPAFLNDPKVPSLKEVNFGKVKLWAVEHFWTDFDLRKRRDKKMDQISDQTNLYKLN